MHRYMHAGASQLATELACVLLSAMHQVAARARADSLCDTPCTQAG